MIWKFKTRSFITFINIQLESQIKFLWEFKVKIFTILDINSILHGTIFLFCWNSKTNNCRYLKFTSNSYFIIWYTQFSKYFFLLLFTDILIFFSFISVNFNTIFLFSQKAWKFNTRSLIYWKNGSWKITQIHTHNFFYKH